MTKSCPVRDVAGVRRSTGGIALVSNQIANEIPKI
jgi:hypothetical protein